MKYILALDGGGIRGVLTATILARIEAALGKPAGKIFDLIAGTSTGGIMACGLSIGMSAQALAALYATRGVEIFSRSSEWEVRTVGGVLGPKYQSSAIEGILKEVLGDKTLADCKTAIVVPSYAIEDFDTGKGASFFFKSWLGPDCYLRDVARSTSAAETYFPPYQFTNLAGKSGAFTDGGTFCNSPGLAALADATDLWPTEAKTLIAIGTGQFQKDIPYAKAKDWGLVAYGLNIVDVFMDGQADVVDHWLRRWPGLKYERLQAALPAQGAAMDNTAPANIAALETLGQRVDIGKAVELLQEAKLSILISDIRYYGSVDMPEADGATIGGTIDFSKRVEFGAVTGISSTYAGISSVAGDTAVKLAFMGRDSTGVIVTGVLSLNGTTKVNTPTALERLLAACQTGGSIAGLVNPGGTTASGDVALISNSITASGTFQAGCANATTSNPPVAQLAAGQGALAAPGMVLHVLTTAASGQIRRILQVNPNALGADFVAIDYNWNTIPSNTATYEFAPGMFFEQDGSSQGVALTGSATHVLAITRLFDTAQADVAGGSNRTYYEKIFVNNNNTATALTSAQVEIFSNSPALPAGASLNFALASGLADQLTATNRQTAPTTGSLTTQSSGFPAQPTFLAVQSPGNLPASLGPGNTAGAVALWPQLNLASGTAAYEGSPGADIRTTGNTT